MTNSNTNYIITGKQYENPESQNLNTLYAWTKQTKSALGIINIDFKLLVFTKFFTKFNLNYL